MVEQVGLRRLECFHIRATPQEMLPRFVEARMAVWLIEMADEKRLLDFA